MKVLLPPAQWLFIHFVLLSSLHAQQPEWLVFNSSNSSLPDNQVQAIAAQDSIVWLGTTDGLARYDGHSWVVHDTTNSPLPSSHITAICPDGTGVTWIGTDKGIVRFDGVTWQVFDTSNSPLPNNTVTALALALSGILWIGTEKGLVKRDSMGWTVYDDTNSGLFDNLVRSVAVAPKGSVWVGTFDPFNFQGRLTRFDGVSWTRSRLDREGLPSSFPDALIVDSDTSAWLGTRGTTGGALVRITGGTWNVLNYLNSGLPRGGVTSIAREGTVVWIATADGLASFDGVAWKTFTREMSGLPENALLTVAIDSKGNKWIGTLAGGVAVYREGGVITSTEANRKVTATQFELLQNYPNPFNPRTEVRSSVPSQAATGRESRSRQTAGPDQMSEARDVKLVVYDLLGRQVAVLVDERRGPGTYRDAFDGTGLASGVYICRLTAGTFVASRRMVLLK